MLVARSAAIGLVITTLAAGPVQAADRGQEIAARCARCHAIAANDDSPTRITIPFRNLGRRYPIAMLVEAAKTGTIDGHDEMPMFDLGPADMKALLAYIDRLNPEVPGYARLVPDRAP
ncbi:MAG: c-type cytochrome [Hyphomicrobiaceae bacterium]|jgi:mono/diheme cytochrome c family protein